MCKKKILIICNSEFAYQKFIKETFFELKKKYHVDILIGLEEDMKKKFHNKSFFYIYMPKKFIKFIIFMPFIIFFILKKIKQNNYSLIIHNNRNASICSRIAIFFLKKKIISVYFARGMYFHDNQNYILFFFSYLLEILLLFKTDLILSQTNEDINRIKFFLNFFNIKKRYIGNGTDILKKKKKIKNKNQFIAICRITKNKGLEDLFFAFSEINKFYPKATLTIVGGPRSVEDYKYMEFLKKKFDLKKVLITGMVRNVKKYLFPHQIYVLPSYREGLSRSLLEAMSCGLIPIVSNIRGSREVIINNYNGVMYNFADKKDLFKKMKNILMLNLKKKNFLIKNSINTIRNKFLKKNYIKNQTLEIDNIINIKKDNAIF
jgi:glycosyltransferase involved in cell wall biosynthesis